MTYFMISLSLIILLISAMSKELTHTDTISPAMDE